MEQDKIQTQLNNIVTQLQSLNNYTATSEKIVAIKKDTEEIKNHLATLNGSVKTHTDKIGTLEKWKDTWTGKLTVIGGVAGIGVALLLYYIERCIY